MLTRDHFVIRNDIIFFNHGSFGACPKPVFEKYQAWQLELEQQPVEFIQRRREALIDEATNKIAEFLNAPAEELIFVLNATTGVNVVAKSLKLEHGAEILTTNHEYGAIDKTMAFVAQKTGASIVRHHIEVPYTTDEAFTDAFFASVTDKTKVIYLSHITSSSAIILPVAQICHRARELGIFTIIDGAHVPGQLPLDLTEVGADAYSGNFHKWLCAPKGAGFLHVRKEHHSMIDPLVISHGWVEGASFHEQNRWGGTMDPSAFLTVPTAIEYFHEHNWTQIRAECHELALMTQARLCDDFGLPPVSENQFSQMVAIPVPDCDVTTVKERLYDEFHIEVPFTRVNDKPHVRVSFQAYNSAEDAQALIKALHAILD
jgi:isopenicillin-N epimerase